MNEGKTAKQVNVMVEGVEEDGSPMDCVLCFKPCRHHKSLRGCYVCGIVFHETCGRENKWARVDKCPQCRTDTVGALREREGSGVEVVDVGFSDDDNEEDEEEVVFVEAATTTATITTVTTMTKAATTAKSRDGKYVCGVDGCEHMSKTTQHRRQHRAAIHDTNVVWHECDAVVCEYRSNFRRDLKQHKAQVHDEDVVWNYCDAVGCEYRAKMASHIK